MTLSSGTRLGPYEITSQIGAGGMGEVYRATDTKLKRSVALKLLPAASAGDPERRERFAREAQAVAALNHPNIVTIHSVEQADGQFFLTMELVEGRSLADALPKGGLPLERVLQIAIPVADAIAAAHQKGITHRDLKPANIMIGEGEYAGRVKVLDFGLAKLAEQTAVDATALPTAAITGEGRIVGTVAYMSPEQAEGKPVDARSDLFSLGVVMYEMATGQRPFTGDTPISIISSIVKDTPPSVTSVNPTLPRDLGRIIRRAMTKDLSRRYQTAADLRNDLEELKASLDSGELAAPAVASAAASGRRARPWVMVAGLALLALVAGGLGGALLGRDTPAPAAAVRLSFPRPSGTLTNSGRPSIDISPDGTKVVLVMNQRLYLRRLDATEAEPIVGTESVSVRTPVFSPDGEWLAFEQDNELKKIPVGGGVPVGIVASPANFGVSWDGDRLVFANDDGVFRVSSAGGTPEQILARAPGEAIYGPRMLPDGDHILLTVTNAVGADRWDRAQIVAQSISTGARTVLVRGGSDARYVSTGHLAYAVGTSLFAVPFDARSLRVTGAPMAIQPGVRRVAVPADNTGAANFSVARNGTLVYVPEAPFLGRSVVMADMEGHTQPLQAVGVHPRVSPDGTLLAMEDVRDNAIWIHPLTGNASPRRLTLEGVNGYPVWAPDGSWIAFTSNRGAGRGIYRQRADGSGMAEPLAEPLVSGVPVFWSKDGQNLFYVSGQQLWSVAPGEPPRPRMELGSTDSDASVSPDGAWVAFDAVEGGRNVAYIRSLRAGNGSKYSIAAGGGHHPLWAPDGRRIFYIANDNPNLMVVDVTLGPTVSLGQPTVVLSSIGELAGSGRFYDVLPDGKHLVAAVPSAEGSADPRGVVEVVLNWFTELKQRVPTR